MVYAASIKAGRPQLLFLIFVLILRGFYSFAIVPFRGSATLFT
jgi:hypothetical protein